MISEVQQLFDKQYQDRYPLFGTSPTQIVRMLSMLLSKDANIIELGAGDGRDTLFLLKEGFHVKAIDFAANGLEKISEKAMELGFSDKLSLELMDVNEWMPRPCSYDALLGITILDHLNHSEASSLIENIKTSVRLLGYVCLEMYSDRDPAFRLEEKNISEFSGVIKFFSPMNWLVNNFVDSWRVIYYSDRIENDFDHGKPHQHGFSTIIAQRIK